MSQLKFNTLLQGGKYKIVRFISAGGFGCTYEAEHVMLHKKVAIKEFFVKDFCNRDETTSQISVGITSKTALVDKLKKKFVEEAQSLCALEHPNIVHVFDVFEENGTAYYVMDYIDGPSLNDLVKKNGPMSESKALEYIKQVADALKYVHSRNRLHLDIKPGNIMVDDKDRAILIDFGASKQYDEEAGENTSTLLGKTPGYAPLEQMGNDVVKFLPSTDIYALGATFYKLLTGVTPPSATLLASGETLGEMPSSISTGTRNAILQSMQTNKMKRPQNIGAFMAELDGDTEETVVNVQNEPKSTFSAATKQAPAPKPQTQQTSSHKSSNTKVYIFASVVVVAIIVLALVFLPFGSADSTNTEDPEPEGRIEMIDYPIMDSQGNLKFLWTGQTTAESLPYGDGIAKFTANDKNGYKEYQGTLVNGLFEDESAILLYANGSKYEGAFKEGKRTEGTLTLAEEGMYYSGTFRDDKEYNGKWYFTKGKELYSKVIKGKEFVVD